jgi:hypothetical protein
MFELTQDQTAEKNIESVWKIYVENPLILPIYRRIVKCHRSFHRAGEKENLFIIGGTGIGKTTFCKYYRNKFPRVQTDGDDSIPVLYRRVPTPATIKNLATEMLLELGDPKADRGTIENKTLRLRQLLKACRVELMFIDEVQHFIDRFSEKVLSQVADWFKLLIEDVNIPVVLIGLPEALEVLRVNPQLSRRFSHRCELLPFSFGEINETEQFRVFLNTIDGLLPLPERSDLAGPELSTRLFQATEGVIGSVMKLIRFSAVDAISNGLPKIDREILSSVFDEQIKPDKPGIDNPFSSDIVIDSVTVQNAGMNKRIHPCPKKETIADVVRTAN